MIKLALALIVKGSDEEAESLSTCLESVAQVCDGVFITITHKKGEAVNEKVKEVCKDFRAEVSTFEWVNDFAKARNFNFSQVPKDYDYILWLDADDAIRGVERLRQTIEEHTDVDSFAFNYLYAFDEHKHPIVVHMKTQVVRNDGCVEWAGRLHEDFKENRELKSMFVKGIERIHLSNETRFGTAKERNLEVAEEQLKELPDDPRSYWNVGNSLKALGRDKESLEMLEKFIKLSKSDDEKYIARLRMAESYWHLGDKPQGIEQAQFAIGLKPHYPDAYHLLGTLYFESKQFHKAKEMYLAGLLKKPPIYSIIVYNPRDYDYVPMMNLAKTYFNLSLPQLALPLLKGCLQIYPDDENLKNVIEKISVIADESDKVIELVSRLQGYKSDKRLKTELDKLDNNFKYHPAVCNLRNNRFIKKESSGKDLVIFCGFTEEEWTPETAKTKGIGGSEEAVIWISNLLAEAGWNVTVFNNCGYKEQQFGKVTYKPFMGWNPRDAQDVTIFWRSPKYLDYDINSKKIFVDLHDVIPAGEFNEKRLAKIDRVFVKSQFHKSLFPNIPDEKFAVIPNGIDSELFKEESVKEPGLLINTSSPDRSLSAFLDIYEKVKETNPDAKAVWAYGWGVFDVVHGEDLKMMEWKNSLIQRMQELGVQNLGRISHSEVANLYKRGSIFLYPSEFAEIDCISLTKAIASGAVPVTTDFSAMGEKAKYGGSYIHSDKNAENWCPPGQYDHAFKGDKDQFVKAVNHILKFGYVGLKREQIIKDFDWNNVANEWLRVIEL